MLNQPTSSPMMTTMFGFFASCAPAWPNAKVATLTAAAAIIRSRMRDPFIAVSSRSIVSVTVVLRKLGRPLWAPP